MFQPLDFVYRDSPHFVCRPFMASSKPPPLLDWYHELHQYLLYVGFFNSSANTSLFIYNNGGCTIYLLVYVDDIIITSNSDSATQDFIVFLSYQFSIKGLSYLHYFLSIEVLLPHQHGLTMSIYSKSLDQDPNDWC